MRRVVVTGMGAITPVGNDIDTMWANMLAGVNGVEKITSFDTSDLKVHLAGTVKNFEPEKYRSEEHTSESSHPSSSRMPSSA